MTTVALGALLLPLFLGEAFARGAFIGPLDDLSEIASTVPANGDVNPYGVAIVERSTGRLAKGSVLVSNFNAVSNLQGTGTTIVQISPRGDVSVFAQLDAGALPGACPGGVGLTTALVALSSGWVVVGSLPTTDGTAATAQAGCLIVLDSSGHPTATLSGGAINGPWDMTAFESDDFVELFVADVLDGTVAANGGVVSRGNVLRIDLWVPEHGKPHELARTVVGSGFGTRTDPAALVIGPTGLGLDDHGTLFVADTLANRVAAIPFALLRGSSAGTGRTVFAGAPLNAPLGLAVAPDGDILTVNGGDGNLVDLDRAGHVATLTISPNGAGALFGLAIDPSKPRVYFVDDGNNTLNRLDR